MTDERKITQHCITCGEDGHTYINCPKAPFGEILAGAFGAPDLTGRRSEVIRNLEEIDSEREKRGNQST